MWKLIKIKDEHNPTVCIYTLLVGEEHSVGRKNTSILILNDASISRKHAIFKVKHSVSNMSNPSKLSELILVDCGSKFGSCLNDLEVEAQKEYKISHNDIITFGKLGSTFRVKYEPLIIVTSCLEPSIKHKLKLSLHQLGGYLVSEWREDCTHLVMNEIKITAKTICTLAALKYIVTPNYFEQCLLCAKKNQVLPDPEKYLSPLQEPSIDESKVSFKASPLRKTLFINKLFICLSEKQCKKLSSAIIQAGGNCITINDNEPLKEAQLVAENTCVLQAEMGSVESQSQAVWSSYLPEITELLKRHNKRFIPESDLGLAVVYVSTEKYCNPSLDLGSTFLKSSNLKTQSLECRTEVLVTETEEYSQDGLFKMPSIPSSQANDIPTRTANTNKRSASKETSDLSTPSLTISESIATFNFIKPKVSTKRSLPEPEFEARPSKLFKMHDKENISEVLKNLKVQDNSTTETSDFSKTEELSQFEDNNHMQNITSNQTSFNNVPIKEEETFLSSKSSYSNDENFLTQVKVEYVSLIKPQIINSSPQSSYRSGINFKAFKKVPAAIFRVFPQIIGGSDLISHFATINNGEDWVDETIKNEKEEADDRAFLNWGNSTRGNKRKR